MPSLYKRPFVRSVGEMYYEYSELDFLRDVYAWQFIDHVHTP